MIEYYVTTTPIPKSHPVLNRIKTTTLTTTMTMRAMQRSTPPDEIMLCSAILVGIYTYYIYIKKIITARTYLCRYIYNVIKNVMTLCILLLWFGHYTLVTDSLL